MYKNVYTVYNRGEDIKYIEDFTCDSNISWTIMDYWRIAYKFKKLFTKMYMIGTKIWDTEGFYSQFQYFLNFIVASLRLANSQIQLEQITLI